MHRVHKMTGLMLLGLLLSTGGLTACATTHGGHKAKLASKKKHSEQDDSKGFGIYNPGSVNDKILRHGQKVMGSNALGSY